MRVAISVSMSWSFGLRVDAPLLFFHSTRVYPKGTKYQYSSYRIDVIYI